VSGRSLHKRPIGPDGSVIAASSSSRQLINGPRRTTRRDAQPSVRDTTYDARKAGGDRVIEQSQAVVTIENIDFQRLFVSYRTQDGMRAMRAVNDKRLLEALRDGDRIEITLTRERAVDIRRKDE
jgi:hypothetical protein